MTKSPLLDTHAWVWWMLGDPRLSARERTELDGLPSGQRPRLCDISLWEVAMLVQLGRLRLDDALEDWLRIAASPSTVEVIPITPAVVAGGKAVAPGTACWGRGNGAGGTRATHSARQWLWTCHRPGYSPFALGGGPPGSDMDPDRCRRPPAVFGHSRTAADRTVVRLSSSGAVESSVFVEAGLSCAADLRCSANRLNPLHTVISRRSGFPWLPHRRFC